MTKEDHSQTGRFPRSGLERDGAKKKGEGIDLSAEGGDRSDEVRDAQVS